MSNFEKSYFGCLPNEILVKILCLVDTVDLSNFCDVYGCDYFLQERNVIQKVNLFRRYELTDLKFLSKRIVEEYINTLNINGLYWVAGSELRKFISKLVNLENLYAIKTTLSLTDNDVETYTKTKVSKLALTVGRGCEISLKKVPSVTTLYIDYAGSTVNMENIKWKFPSVVKVWMDFDQPGATICTFQISGVNEKVFCRVISSTPVVNYAYLGLERYYINRRACHPYIICCERFLLDESSSRSESDILESAGSQAEVWQVLSELRVPKPYGPMDARRLFLNEATLENILFEELNFHHGPHACNQRLLEAYDKILKSRNSQAIKKLCIMLCSLQRKGPKEYITDKPESFKRRRVAFDKTTTSHPVEEMFGNFLDLRNLEIFVCKLSTYPWVNAITALPYISMFKMLESLTIEVPAAVDGSFLISVLGNCKRLKSLKITAISQNENLNYNLHKAIPEATSLIDFRYENHRIRISNLMESFCLIKRKKLQRIMLVCNEIIMQSSDVDSLEKFLKSNPQLIFFCFVILEGAKKFKQCVQSILIDYKKQHPAKTYIVAKSIFSDRGFPVPDIHLSEMVHCDSTVATLDAFREFSTF